MLSYYNTAFLICQVFFTQIGFFVKQRQNPAEKLRRIEVEF